MAEDQTKILNQLPPIFISLPHDDFKISYLNEKAKSIRSPLALSCYGLLQLNKACFFCPLKDPVINDRQVTAIEIPLGESIYLMNMTVDPESGEVLHQLTDVTSQKKERDRLREQAIRDPLTNLFNRRYMDEVLPRELSRARRDRQSMAILMIDVDHFKKYNDAYGHAVGDLVLQRLANFLQAHCREYDIACRYGGEEFILMLWGMPIDKILDRIEIIRNQFRELKIINDDIEFNVPTLSIGVSVYPSDSNSIEQLLKEADNAVYKAKHDGRDRIVVASGKNKLI